jgi:hypothetical protein
MVLGSTVTFKVTTFDHSVIYPSYFVYVVWDNKSKLKQYVLKQYVLK